MGRWLSRLNIENDSDTQATKATKLQVQEESQGFVGSVAPFLGQVKKFIEPPGYEGGGWLFDGVEGLSQDTLERFLPSHRLRIYSSLIEEGNDITHIGLRPLSV